MAERLYAGKLMSVSRMEAPPERYSWSIIAVGFELRHDVLTSSDDDASVTSAPNPNSRATRRIMVAALIASLIPGPVVAVADWASNQKPAGRYSTVSQKVSKPVVTQAPAIKPVKSGNITIGAVTGLILVIAVYIWLVLFFIVMFVGFSLAGAGLSIVPVFAIGWLAEIASRRVPRLRSALFWSIIGTVSGAVYHTLLVGSRNDPNGIFRWQMIYATAGAACFFVFYLMMRSSWTPVGAEQEALGRS